MFKPANPEVLKRLLAPLKPKTNSVSYIFSCPKCQKKDKLYIRRKDGRFVCFYCREKDRFQGTAEFALREILGLSLEELRAELYGEANTSNQGRITIEIKDFFGDGDENPEDDDPMVPVDMEFGFFPMSHLCAAEARQYLVGRGITEDMWDAYKIVYMANKRRVVFPVCDGETVWGYQARAIDKDVQPKILTSKGLKRDRLLMFMDRVQQGGHAILCEGPVDAIKFHLVGGAVATMGKAVTDRQIDILRDKEVKRVYLGLDPDAFAETQALVAKLKPDFEVYKVEVPDGYKDFGEMDIEHVARCFRDSRPILPIHASFRLNNPWAAV